VPPVLLNPSQNYHKSRTALVKLWQHLYLEYVKGRKIQKTIKTCMNLVQEFVTKTVICRAVNDKKTKIREDLNKETLCILRVNNPLSSINLLKTKRIPHNLKTQFVPRSKHFSSRL